jgi:hypothetical protein
MGRSPQPPTGSILGEMVGSRVPDGDRNRLDNAGGNARRLPWPPPENSLTRLLQS